jgi:undecaprenyl pyrophosphate phosphatase UppP
MWDLISKLTLIKGVQIAVILFANLIAPYWFFMHYYPELVAGDTMWKQMIYCLAVGVPLTIIGYVTETIDHTYKYPNDIIPDENKYNFRLITYSCVFMIVVFYLVVVFKYYGLMQHKKEVNSLITSLYVGTLFVAILSRWSRKREKKRESERQLKEKNKIDI